MIIDIKIFQKGIFRMLKKCMLMVLLSCILWVLSGCSTDTRKDKETCYKLKLDSSVIVLPENPDAVKKFAARELKKHLELITGRKIAILQNEKNIGDSTFPFYIGIPFPGDTAKLQREEARYKITSTGIYMYGEDFPEDVQPIDLFNLKKTRTGTLSSVYFFLENELNVKWIGPGDDGIIYANKNILNLDIKEFSWIPTLKIRYISYSNNWIRFASGQQGIVPASLSISKSEAAKKDMDTKIWYRRMRMGYSYAFSFGHSFGGWWEEYGASHPDFFSLFNGKRIPDKMCVSNRELHEEIVKRWLEAREKNKLPDAFINICENDGYRNCSCPECVKLDYSVLDHQGWGNSPKYPTINDMKHFGESMTDRYIWFANEVLKAAREKVPEAKVIIYAYANYLYPPHREKVSDGVVIGTVTSSLMNEKELDTFYKGWHSVGAREIFQRPNDLFINPCLPFGAEKQIFESFKVGVRNGTLGIYYDILREWWDIVGLENYVLTKGFIYPEKDFSFWEDEYCSTFGDAQNDVKEYFSYWRENWSKNIWNEKLYSNKDDIVVGVGVGGARMLWVRSQKFFKKEDFDFTDKILNTALGKNLKDSERIRLLRLKKVNQHSRLMFNRIVALSDKNMPESEKRRIYDELLDFRIKNKNDLHVCWPALFRVESLIEEVFKR